MQAAKLAIAFAHSARCAGVAEGGPPPGRYLRQACIADWNCGESGRAPVTTTPGRWIASFGAVAADPIAADNPLASRQDANAAGLGLAALVEVGAAIEVVVRRATEGDFEPPQPTARTPSAESMTPKMSVRVELTEPSRRLVVGERPAR
jgi:hypothetical protein